MIALCSAYNFFFKIAIQCFHRQGKFGKLFPTSARMLTLFKLIRLSRISHNSSNGVLAIPARVIATSFALACFAGTLCFGLYNGNDAPSIMFSALIVGFFALLVGFMIGAIMLRSVNEQIERHRANNPIPNEKDLKESDTPQAAVG